MTKTKIHILFHFREGPYGGGNQFLKLLKKNIITEGLWSETVKNADIILVNSYQEIVKAAFYKLIYPEKIFVHRIDGPIKSYRGTDNKSDFRIFIFNNLFADGTIFQSKWSQNENYKQGLDENFHEKVIINACDASIFEKTKIRLPDSHGKIKLIAVSWSSNLNKGFHFYVYLDRNLDFSKFDMTFVGNSPVMFKNIKIIPPVNSLNLSGILKKHHIYVTASKNDPCSNSLIEAQSVGLPALVVGSGGHAEIIKNGGEVFKDFKDFLQKLNLIVKNYIKYQNQIKIQNEKETCDKYLNFIRKIHEDVKLNKYHPKKINTLQFIWFLYRSL